MYEFWCGKEPLLTNCLSDWTGLFAHIVQLLFTILITLGLFVVVCIMLGLLMFGFLGLVISLYEAIYEPIEEEKNGKHESNISQ